MENLFIPHTDTIPVAWGWFQFLLLLTFPLHLLTMNAMLGGLILGVIQHFKGGEIRLRLAHRIAIVLPLIIATTVNLGVAPFLFAQVLYGQFLYTSSVLMGFVWILVIPVLIVAYYGAYLYDFRFVQLGRAGIWIGTIVSLFLLAIGWAFSNNMLLMVLPQTYAGYFDHMNGTLLATGHINFPPRYLHMMLGSIAIGGLFVALLGRFKAEQNPKLANHALHYGMRSFLICTIINILAGTWYLFSLPVDVMRLFLGGQAGPTAVFILCLLLISGVIYGAVKEKLMPTLSGAVILVILMTFIRSWVRSGFLADWFTLDKLQLAPQYSSMYFFFVTLAVGIICLTWLLRKTVSVLNQP